MKKTCIGIIIAAFCLLAVNASAYEHVMPSEAYDMVVNEGAYIIDVRTQAEWLWVGHPGTNNQGEGSALEGHVLNISLGIYKNKKYRKTSELAENRRFVRDAQKLLAYDDIIITMCRSGGRSIFAAIALEEAGFTNVYNIKTGFEGSSDDNGYRSVNGWKNDGLPYNYSDTGMYTR